MPANENTSTLPKLLVFTATVFTSASLLFVVQPMVGKMILPHLGGSASVWTTCMLFFQGALVAGYVYAHGLAQRLTPKRQVWMHLGLIVAAAATSLPLDIQEGWLNTASAPAGWLLLTLLVSIGLPLFVVSSSAPLLQHWFGFTDHPEAEDPYFLYAASNIGSMLGLLAYPFVVERYFAVGTQGWLWAGGFAGLLVLTAGCGWYTVLDADDESADDEPAAPARPEDADEAAEPLGWRRRGWWVLCAFIPSSLMLGVTHYLTTDIASVPLLWVIPLALYLLSYILVFARLPVDRSTYRMVLPLVAPLILAATYVEYLSLVILAVAHLWLFFLYAMYFHGELARDRPDPRYLTDFYIWMSVGGALGGLFNSLVAPVLFDRAIEYFLVMGAALAFVPPPETAATRDDSAPAYRRPSTWLLAGVLAATAAIYLWSTRPPAFLETSVQLTALAALVGLVAVRLLKPRWAGAALAAIVVAGLASYERIPGALEYERSFFANYTVYERTHDDKTARTFLHGTTTHGLQVMEDGMRSTPYGYHHPTGPVGQVVREIPHQRVGVLGLGVGAMAAYAEPDEDWLFYEIDPVVEDIAREYFTYLEQCGEPCRVKIGDGRNLLEQADPHGFDLLFLDAYNSDSVPTHLLTREALQLYLSKLDEDGVLVFHCSNRYLDIEGIVGALAKDAGLVARTRDHVTLNPDLREFVSPTTYTVVARETADLRALHGDPVWRETSVADVVWTDSYTNIVSVFDWDTHTSTGK